MHFQDQKKRIIIGKGWRWGRTVWQPQEVLLLFEAKFAKMPTARPQWKEVPVYLLIALIN